MPDIFGIPSNTGDLLFCECENRRELERRVLKLFADYGYNEIITPSLEYYALFAKDRAFTDEAMYKLTDSKNRLVVLRPDNTVPVGRVISSRLRGMALPMRLCYDQNVFRANGLLRLKRDETTECGIELVGVGGLRADTEALMLAVSSLRVTAGEGFKLELGNAGYFKAIISELELGEDGEELIRGLIASKNYAALATELERFGKAADELKAMPSRFGGPEVIAEAKKSCPNKEAMEALCHLEKLCEKLVGLGCGDCVMVDLGLVNQIDYYTGIVFRGYIGSRGEAVVSGGRYDGLFEDGGKPLPAVGFSINIDAVNGAVCEKPVAKTPDAVIFYDDGCESRAYALSDSLKSDGLLAELSVFETAKDARNAAVASGCKRFITVTDDGEREEKL